MGPPFGMVLVLILPSYQGVYGQAGYLPTGLGRSSTFLVWGIGYQPYYVHGRRKLTFRQAFRLTIVMQIFQRVFGLKKDFLQLNKSHLKIQFKKL